MHPIITPPIALIVSVAVLFGLLVSDFKVNDAVEVAIISSLNNSVDMNRKIIAIPSMSTPNIETNWFSSSSGVTYQMPSAQARKSDDDERISVGGTMGESFSNNDDF